MMLPEEDIMRAAELLAKCEQSMGRTIKSNIAGLFADNFNDWSAEKCAAMKDALQSGYGAAGFYRLLYRDAYPIGVKEVAK